MSDMMKKAKEYSLLVTEISEKSSELDHMKKKKDELQNELLEWFTDADAPDRLSIGGRTLFPKKQIYASINTETKFVDIMLAHDLSDMLTVNSQTLSSHYRELDAKGEVPEWLDNIVSIYEKHVLSSRKDDK